MGVRPHRPTVRVIIKYNLIAKSYDRVHEKDRNDQVIGSEGIK